MQFPNVAAVLLVLCIQCSSKDWMGWKGWKGLPVVPAVENTHTLHCYCTKFASYLNGTSTPTEFILRWYMLHARSPKTIIMYNKIVK